MQQELNMESSSLRTGWVDGWSIGHWLDADPALLGSMPWCVITYLDSNPSVADITSLRQTVADVMPFDSAVVSPTASVVSRHLRETLFSGFDELWLFDQRPKMPKPSTFAITAPVRLDRESPAGLRSWFEASDARLGLGDGYGLNYITDSAATESALLISFR